MQLKNIEEQICNALKPFAKSALDRGLSDRQWTTEMKEIIGDLGVSNGFEVCATGFPDKFSTEWLFDITWYRNDSNGNLVETPLIVESEWNSKIEEIKYDFEKLLVARADYKVMIFQGSTTNIPNIISQLKQEVNVFKATIPQDRYLFIAYNMDKGEFEFDQLIVK
ncbi:MAG: hypothetical protein HOG05_00780 [Bacteroidetes bacterium]|nr:hypothetical protein [Bacteroidota bacterium]MBT7994933.1 hypothetical protein [Bacteroidota bacterium]